MLYFLQRLVIFDESELFAGNRDDRGRLGALRGEFGANAELFHNVAEAVDRSVVREVGATGKFLDFRTGNDEFGWDWRILRRVGFFDFFDLPGVRELLRTEFDDGERLFADSTVR